jgi:4-coumarate--CoA ligase
VTVFSPNHVDYAPCVLGILRAGGIVSTANPLYTEYELRGQIEKSNSTILVCHPGTLEVGLKAAEGTKIEKVMVFGGDDMGKSNVIPFNSLAETENLMMSPPAYVTDSVGVNDLAMLPFSSGTTGLPKGTMLSHNNISINLQQFVAPEGDYMSDNTTIISPLPLFHIYGFTAGMLHSSWMANKLVTMAAFDLVKFCELVQEHKPERAHLVPPIILGLAKHPIVDNYDFTSLKMVVSAAAPLGGEVQIAVRDRLQIGVKQAWGMSEVRTNKRSEPLCWSMTTCLITNPISNIASLIIAALSHRHCHPRQFSEGGDAHDRTGRCRIGGKDRRPGNWGGSPPWGGEHGRALHQGASGHAGVPG